MARTCTICTHPLREEMETAILKKLYRGLLGISRHFAVSEDALSRHKRHMGRGVVPRRRTEGKSFAELFDGLYNQLEEIEKKAESTTDKLAVIREKRNMLNMFVQLGFQEALRRQQQEQQQEHKDVSLEVQQLIDKLFDEEAEE